MDLPEQSSDGRLLESLSLEDWEHRQVYAQFGLPIFFCQVLEHNLVHHL